MQCWDWRSEGRRNELKRPNSDGAANDGFQIRKYVKEEWKTKNTKNILLSNLGLACVALSQLFQLQTFPLLSKLGTKNLKLKYPSSRKLYHSIQFNRVLVQLVSISEVHYTTVQRRLKFLSSVTQSSISTKKGITLYSSQQPNTTKLPQA